MSIVNDKFLPSNKSVMALAEMQQRMALHDEVMKELADVPGATAIERVRRLKRWYQEGRR